MDVQSNDKVLGDWRGTLIRQKWHWMLFCLRSLLCMPHIASY